MASLESSSFPGQHVGIQDNGCVKPPAACVRGRHASFTVELVEAAGTSCGGPGTYQVGPVIVIATMSIAVVIARPLL